MSCASQVYQAFLFLLLFKCFQLKQPIFFAEYYLDRMEKLSSSKSIIVTRYRSSFDYVMWILKLWFGESRINFLYYSNCSPSLGNSSSRIWHQSILTSPLECAKSVFTTTRHGKYNRILYIIYKQHLQQCWMVYLMTICLLHYQG